MNAVEIGEAFCTLAELTIRGPLVSVRAFSQAFRKQDNHHKAVTLEPRNIGAER